MATLSDIQGIGKSFLVLLEAVGCGDLKSLAAADEATLLEDLAAVNKKLHVVKRPPSKANVKKWIATARKLLPEEPSEMEREISPPEEMPALVNYEENEEVVSLLEQAPCAIPLPSRVLVRNGLGVSDIPPALLLSEYPGDLDMRVQRRVPANPIQTIPKHHFPNSGITPAASGPKLKIDVSRLRPFEERETSSPRVPASSTTDDRVSLLRAPREETNRGKSPNSRFYIRGVLHSHPWSIWWGAVVTLALLFITPLAIVSSALLLLSREMPKVFSWSPTWLLVFPVVWPFVGLAWLLWGIPGKCRICGIRLFVHRHHRKNSKAHHIPLIGYVIPLCLHIILFRWFRCTHCGTPVRLKQ